jgi:phage I-like protein
MALVERDAARQELAKNVEMNEKLQKLCRTLQDANKETSALLRERADSWTWAGPSSAPPVALLTR